MIGNVTETLTLTDTSRLNPRPIIGGTTILTRNRITTFQGPTSGTHERTSRSKNKVILLVAARHELVW